VCGPLLLDIATILFIAELRVAPIWSREDSGVVLAITWGKYSGIIFRDKNLHKSGTERVVFALIH